MCNTCMPRSRGPPKRRSVYLNTDEIADLRVNCIRFRNRYTRIRRQKTGDVAARATEAYKGYRAARKALRIAIRKAKSQA